VAGGECALQRCVHGPCEQLGAPTETAQSLAAHDMLLSAPHQPAPDDELSPLYIVIIMLQQHSGCRHTA
jgi:hypothetical protein